MTIENRLYRISLAFLMALSALCIVGNLLAGFPHAASIKWGVLLGLGLAAYRINRVERLRDVGMAAFFLFLIAVFLPLAFMDSGGSNNNAMGYTFLLAVVITYLFKGRTRGVLFGLLILVFEILLLLEYFQPRWITQYDPSTQLIDRMIQVPLQLVAVFLVLRLFARTYVDTNRQLARQRRRLEASMAQLASSEKRLQAANQALEQLRITDKLTRLFNRSKLDEVLDQELARIHRYGSAFCLAMLDIDHFKKVNDTHGHLAGDQVLVAFAQRLNSGIRRTDTLGRWGGEEFMILFPDAAIENVHRVVEKLIGLIARDPLAGIEGLTCSAGLTLAHPGDTVTDLVRRADDALYKAKQAGRNRVERLSKSSVPSH